MRKLVRVLILSWILGLLVGSLAPPAAAGWTNNNPARLSVYDWNIHKMEDTWRGWIRYIRDNNIPVPDLILLQDVGSLAERQQFQDALGNLLGGTWHGRGGGTGYHWAVVWRAARFSSPKSRTFDIFGGQECEFGAGWPAIQVRLYDDLGGFYVSAVSFKTPPHGTLAERAECAWRNSRRVNNMLREEGWSGRMLLMGTDANTRDRENRDDASSWLCHYSGTNGRLPGSGCDGFATGNLGYEDPIYTLCGGDDVDCFNQNATFFGIDRNRIDYLFAKLRRPNLGDEGIPLSGNTETLPKGRNADGSYCYSWGCSIDWSDHRSVRSLIDYVPEGGW
jgi:hypothetical protein